MERRIPDLTGHQNGMLWSLVLEGAKGGAWTWSHFPLSDVRARAFLDGPAALPEGPRGLIASDDRHVQFQHAGAWAWGVLPDLERDLAGEALEPGRLVFACDGRRLVTARLHPLCAIDEVRREAERGQPPAGPGDALSRLLLQYLEVVGRQLEHLGEALDLIEDRVLDEDIDLDGRRLGPLRRQFAVTRRELAGLRSVLNRLLAPRSGQRAGFLAEHLAGVPGPLDDLDREAAGLQDRARLLHEEIDTLINSATNRSMRALTVLSTLLIPPTLIVGAFGMNLEGIPFGHTRAGFFLATGLCVAVVAAAYSLLKRLKLLP